MDQILLALSRTGDQIVVMGRRLQIAVLVVAIVIGCLVAWQVTRLSYQAEAKSDAFRGKSLEAWFYGSRTDFFSQPVRASAQEALDGVGTNAFPFLLSQLEAGRGTPVLYNRAYRVLPGWLKSRLPFPLSGDDIRAITFDHLGKLRGRLSREQLDAIAELLPKLQNPRLRMLGLNFLNQHYHPGLPGLCRKLLEDPEPAIRLEAALPVAESAIAGDPAEPRLAAILLLAFEHREIRDHWVDINWYGYGQQPPGGSGRPLWITPVPNFLDQSEVLRSRIKTALIRLEPYLTPEQRATFLKLSKQPGPLRL